MKENEKKKNKYKVDQNVFIVETFFLMLNQYITK